MLERCSKSMRFVASMLTLTAVLVSSSVAQAEPQPQGPVPSNTVQLLDRLAQSTGGKSRVSYHSETGKVRFIGATPERPVGRPAGIAASAQPEVAARGFMGEYGKLFGLNNPAAELRTMRVQSGDQGRSSVRFQQVYKGVPVLAGEMYVNLDGARNVLSASGEALADLNLNVTPALSVADARTAAIGLVSKHRGIARDELSANKPELAVFNPSLVGGPGRRVSTLVWRTEVTTSDDMVREFVLIDAQRGKVVLNFNEIAHAKKRQVCNFNNVPNTDWTCTTAKATRVEGQAPNAVVDVNKAYDYSGAVYDFWKNRFNRDSIDGKGMTMLSTVKYCSDAENCPWQNASWNGKQMTYGEGFANADDVVGHEFGHGINDFTSNLFYYYQSGAIDESLSDVWGEYIDQLSTAGGGTDTEAVRWQLGEDLPASVGVVRDMKNPPLHDQPDRMRSPLYSFELEAPYPGYPFDNGGVHINSGVNNKAAFLLVDGGTFNGRTVTPLGVGSTAIAKRNDGLAKAARLYFEVQDNMLTSGSDYQDLWDYMQQACTQLIGTKAQITPTTFSSPFTAANCADVKDAVDATEMNLQPVDAAAAHAEAPICPAGQVPTDLFWDDMENTASGNWVTAVSPATASGWVSPDSVFPRSGKFNVWGDDPGSSTTPQPPVDSNIAQKTAVTIPAGKIAYVRFDHYFGFEAGVLEGETTTRYFDGGVVEYSANGGPWTRTDALVTDNGYNTTIHTGFGNPLAGRRAFGGLGTGYRSTRINLGAALAGKSVKFRWRIGTDDLFGYDGWDVDDIRVYTCAAATANPVAPNKLKNQGFEFDWGNDTFVDSWTATDRFTRSPQLKKTGMFSGKLSDTSTGTFIVAQKVPVTAGSTNKLTGSFAIPANAADAFTFRVEVQWLNAANTQIGAVVPVVSRTTNTNSVWTALSKTGLVAPTGTTQAAVRLVGTNLGNAAGTNFGTKVFVDDFYFGQ
jgi:bacillolysin